MMMISNLPSDLVEEILSRVPLRYLKAVRSTCKKWNALTKDRSFTNKHMAKIATSGEKEYLMLMNSRVHLVGVDIHRIQNDNIDLSINRKGQFSSVDNLDEVIQKSQIFICNGSVLCVSDTRFVVWSPYWGKPKWIKRSYKYGRVERFAFGYDKSCGSHNILRLYGNYLNNFEIYDLSSGSWMVPNVTLERDVVSTTQSVSLNGNTYWCGSDTESLDFYLFCFDFTRKRFGQRLTLPFVNRGDVSLAAIKKDQLAVLSKRVSKMEFWVTDKIEPDAVSWRNFLRIDLNLNLRFPSEDFLIDEENKLVVVFDKERPNNTAIIYKNIAYVIGENDYLRKVVLNELPWPRYRRLSCYCFPSYVPIK